MTTRDYLTTASLVLALFALGRLFVLLGWWIT